MQLCLRALSLLPAERQRCLLWTSLIIVLLIPPPFTSVTGFELSNVDPPKGKCQVCKDIVKAFYEGLKKTAKSNYGGGNTHWEESRLGSYAFSEVRLTEVMEGLCSGNAAECHHLLEEHEETVEHFWYKEYSKHTGIDFFQWLCIDNIKVCCPNNTYGPNCEPCKGGLERPCKDNGYCKGEGTREGTGGCICNYGYEGDRCDVCMNGFYEDSRNETHIECNSCDVSCKLTNNTCQGAGPKGCEECTDGYTQSEEEGCQDIDECSNKADLCGNAFFCENNPGSFRCLQCDKECDGCTGYGTDKCLQCREGYHLVEDKCTDIDECAAEPSVCTVEHERCTNREGGFTCICDIGYEREGDHCVLRPEGAKKKKEKANSKKKSEKSKTKKSDSKTTKGKKKKGSKRRKDEPSVLMFNVVMVLYGISGKISQGNVWMTGSLGLLVGVYFYTFASHYDGFR